MSINVNPGVLQNTADRLATESETYAKIIADAKMRAFNAAKNCAPQKTVPVIQKKLIDAEKLQSEYHPRVAAHVAFLRQTSSMYQATETQLAESAEALPQRW